MREVSISRGPDETVLPPADPGWRAALEAALAAAGDDRRRALTELAAAHPSYLDAWAFLSEGADGAVEAYAYARAGYHRGLDQLRASGWRGTGYVRWRHDANRGFLRSLEALRASAERIGEHDEAERCARFLRQLDPEWKGLPAA